MSTRQRTNFILIIALLIFSFSITASAEDRSIFDFKRILQENNISIENMKLLKNKKSMLYKRKEYRIFLKGGDKFDMIMMSPAILMDLSVLFDEKYAGDITEIYGLKNQLDRMAYYSNIGCHSEHEQTIAKEFIKNVKSKWEKQMKNSYTKNGGFYLIKWDFEYENYIEIGKEVIKEMKEYYVIKKDLKTRLMEPAYKNLESEKYQKMLRKAKNYNKNLPDDNAMKKVLNVFELW